MAPRDWDDNILGWRTPAPRRPREPAIGLGQPMVTNRVAAESFYVALPFNDIDDHDHTKPEAWAVIPWFRSVFVRDGRSVCKDRWGAIRHANKVCYARWEDVGPFQTDHWQYVFGNERPRPNRNGNAGLDVSPAVRDYLGLNALDCCDWRFVEVRSVPPGPWRALPQLF